MTDSVPEDAAELVAQHQPDPLKRLQLPDPPAQLPAAEAPGAPRAPQDQQRAPKMKLHKRLERYFTAFFKFGRTQWQAKQAYRATTQAAEQLQSQSADLERIWQSVSALERRHDEISVQLSEGLDQRLEHQMESYKLGLSVLSRTFSDMTRRLDQLVAQGRGEAPATPEAAPPPDSDPGFQSSKDQFYHRLENRYRGSRREISSRLRVYLPDVEAAVLRTDGKPVMDLGCGRGEWLELLSEAGMTALGVDTNSAQIREAQELGLDARLEDAVAALRACADNSLAVVSAHHLIEHLPFDMVAWITREALRVLAPGGILLFETPNTRNVLVGATTFHTDPTHLKPMPEQVLGVLFETAGFYPVDIRHLNAHARFDEFRALPDFNEELAFLMFGPQDLAVLGSKPLTEG